MIHEPLLAPCDRQASRAVTVRARMHNDNQLSDAHHHTISGSWDNRGAYRHPAGLGCVLGYLVAGMATSPLLTMVRIDVSAIQHFAEFGVIMMLFLVGPELEVDKLWP